MENQIKRDVNKLYNFEGTSWNGINIRYEDICGKQLQLAVPDIELSELQIDALNKAIEYANSKEIDIIITVIKEK